MGHKVGNLLAKRKDWRPIATRQTAVPLSFYLPSSSGPLLIFWLFSPDPKVPIPLAYDGKACHGKDMSPPNRGLGSGPVTINGGRVIPLLGEETCNRASGISTGAPLV